MNCYRCWSLAVADVVVVVVDLVVEKRGTLVRKSV